MPARKLTTIPADVTSAVQKIWQAGLGAVTMAQDESGKMFDVLVSVGEQMEKEIRRSGLTPSAAVKRASEGAEDAWKKVQAAFDTQMTGVLHRLGVPTREEIAKLTRRIEHLTQTIESLRARPAARRAGAPKATATRKATARKTTTRARR